MLMQTHCNLQRHCRKFAAEHRGLQQMYRLGMADLLSDETRASISPRVCHCLVLQTDAPDVQDHAV